MKTIKESNTVCFPSVDLRPTSLFLQARTHLPEGTQHIQKHSELERVFYDHPTFLSSQLTKGGRTSPGLSPTSNQARWTMDTWVSEMLRDSSSRKAQQQMPCWNGIQGGRLGCGRGSTLALTWRTNKHPLPTALHLLRNVKTPETCSLETSSPQDTATKLTRHHRLPWHPLPTLLPLPLGMGKQKHPATKAWRPGLWCHFQKQ